MALSYMIEREVLSPFGEWVEQVHGHVINTLRKTDCPSTAKFLIGSRERHIRQATVPSLNAGKSTSRNGSIWVFTSRLLFLLFCTKPHHTDLLQSEIGDGHRLFISDNA